MVIAKPVRALIVFAFLVAILLFLQALRSDGKISLPSRGGKHPVREGADGPDPNWEGM